MVGAVSGRNSLLVDVTYHAPWRCAVDFWKAPLGQETALYVPGQTLLKSCIQGKVHRTNLEAVANLG